MDAPDKEDVSVEPAPALSESATLHVATLHVEPEKPSSPPPPSTDESNSKTASPQKKKLLEKATEDGSSSPERCPICLAPPENKAFTDTCFHSFCFKCIKEWSKIKAECPLCKSKFDNINYNVRSDFDYDQFNVPRPPSSAAAGLGNQQMWFREPSVDFFVARLFEWRERLEVQRENANAAALASTEITVIRQRRLYYRNGTRVSYVNNNNMVCDISAEFYRHNPAQVFRLVPWIKRELFVLFGASKLRLVNRINDIILAAIPTIGITSTEFFNEVQSFFKDKTDHFVSELLSFARSPHDIIAYDRNAHYLTNADYHDLTSSRSRDAGGWNSDSDECEETTTSAQPRRRARPFPVPQHSMLPYPSEPLEPPLSHVNIHMSSSSDPRLSRSSHQRHRAEAFKRKFHQQYQSQRSSSKRKHKRSRADPTSRSFEPHHSSNDVIVIDSSPERESEKDEILVTDDSTTEQTPNREQGSSRWSSPEEDEDCEFVKYIAPPHLRTPDAVVSLDSSDGCDSDVEEKPSSSRSPQPSSSSSLQPSTSSKLLSPLPGPSRPKSYDVQQLPLNVSDSDDRISSSDEIIVKTTVPHKLKSAIVPVLSKSENESDSSEQHKRKASNESCSTNSTSGAVGDGMRKKKFAKVNERLLSSHNLLSRAFRERHNLNDSSDSDDDAPRSFSSSSKPRKRKIRQLSPSLSSSEDF